MHPIESERLRLRAIEPDRDVVPMLALLNDPGFLRFIGDRDVRSEAQAREYIALRVLHSYALNGFGMYAIERLSDGAWLGNAGLVRRDAAGARYRLCGAGICRAGLCGERGQCSRMHAERWACTICMASPTWTTWCPERSCWAWACRNAGDPAAGRGQPEPAVCHAGRGRGLIMVGADSWSALHRQDIR